MVTGAPGVAAVADAAVPGAATCHPVRAGLGMIRNGVEVSAVGFDVPVEPLRRTAHYTGEPGCIADARAFAGEFMAELADRWCAPVGSRTHGDILLLVTELVTNADRHCHGPYILALEGTDESVTVSVYDSSPVLPCVYPRDPQRVGGHGMEIVTALAGEISVQRVPVGKRVTARVWLPSWPSPHAGERGETAAGQARSAG